MWCIKTIWMKWFLFLDKGFSLNVASGGGGGEEKVSITPPKDFRSFTLSTSFFVYHTGPCACHGYDLCVPKPSTGRDTGNGPCRYDLYYLQPNRSRWNRYEIESMHECCTRVSTFIYFGWFVAFGEHQNCPCLKFIEIVIVNVSTCLAQDHWWGFSTRNAHIVHIVNLIRLKWCILLSRSFYLNYYQQGAK